MVGGIVEQVHRVEGRMAVLVRGTDQDADKLLAVNIKGSKDIQPGDTLWWQGRLAYWTPADKSREDIGLTKLGNTYSASLFHAIQDGTSL